METPDLAALLGPDLAAALDEKGYTSLTPVQEAVLAPELAGRDLRISSQTGSGKTVAIGLTLRDVVLEFVRGRAAADRTERAERTERTERARSEGAKPRPAALVITPTRELAKQVEDELGWLYAPLRARVVSVTGGASYRIEHAALARSPAIVVGTPGRLLDHLQRGSIDPSGLGAIVLDEADRMLDLGFRDELEAILATAPEGHRTHLVSATFPREVRALADRVQHDPARVEGTPLGTANADIEHVLYLVREDERIAAMVNLLLSSPGGQTLIFARTRADVTAIRGELGAAGFRVGSLSGDMEQRERNRALDAFKSGELDALVATDVAARGIDVQDIASVIHAEPPNDADTYTHRSGRTGRAGRKGTSAVLVIPQALSRTQMLLRRAGVNFRLAAVPSGDDVRQAIDARLFEELTAEPHGRDADDRAYTMAKRLLEAGHPTRALARLIMRVRTGAACEPREVTKVTPPAKAMDTGRRMPGRDRGAPHGTRGEARGEARGPSRAPERGPSRGEPRMPARGPAARADTRDDARQHGDPGDYVPFRVSFGALHGADARRLLAMVCRRGDIRGSDVGSIEVDRSFSVVAVRREVAAGFARATRDPDPRDPRVTIRPLSGDAPRFGDAPPARRAPRTEAEPTARPRGKARGGAR